LLVSAALAEPVFPPGSSVGLEPPAGMEMASGFQGFEHEPSTSSILIVEMPGAAWGEIDTGFTEEAMAAQGVVDTTREPVTIGDEPAFLVTGRQNAGGMVFRKWILVAQSDGRTAMITAQTPIGSDFSDEAMRKAMLSAVFTAAATIEDQIAALPFTVRDYQEFRPVFVMAGSMLSLTVGPDDEVRNGEQPNIIIASAIAAPPPPEGRAAYAERILRASPIDALEIETSEAFEHDGAAWHEIVATATGADGTPLVVAQIIRFTDDGYLRGVAIDRAERRESILASFRSLMASAAPR
jgi:hypothetical protein